MKKTFIAASMAILTLTACGGGPEEAPETSMPSSGGNDLTIQEQFVRDTGEEQGVIFEDNNSMVIDGEAMQDSEMLEGMVIGYDDLYIEKGFPQKADVTPISSFPNNYGYGFSMGLSSTDTPENLFKYYKEEMASRGWSVALETSPMFLNLTKGDQYFNITIIDNSGTRIISIAYGNCSDADLC